MTNLFPTIFVDKNLIFSRALDNYTKTTDVNKHCVSLSMILSLIPSCVISSYIYCLWEYVTNTIYFPHLHDFKQFVKVLEANKTWSGCWAIIPFAKCIYNYIYFPCLITTNYTHVALPTPIDSKQSKLALYQ